MKKIFSSLVVLLMFTITLGLFGCKQSKNSTINDTTAESITESQTQEETESETEEETTPSYTVEELRSMALADPSIPMPGLYRRNAEYTEFRKAEDFESVWEYYSDIAGFYIFACEEDVFPYEGLRDRWNNLWNSYADASFAKTGFEITITLNDDEVKTVTVLSPEDTEEIFEYVELYLYDDIHQEPGAWYSHLLPEQMTENTIMSSIKVTTGEKIEQVKKIHLVAFVYTEECEDEVFNEDGRYIGGNYREVTFVKNNM